MYLPSLNKFKIVFTVLESMSIPAYPTPQRKLLPCGRVLDMQRALLPLQFFAPGPTGTLGQVRLGDTGHLLEVVMTQVTKVGGTETEEHGD